MPPAEPEDAGLLVSLHRAQRIAEHDSGKEYGRLLRAWMAADGDGILREWYLRKVDGAVTVASADPDWHLLSSLIPTERRDRELFRLVAGMELGPLALDEAGCWRIGHRQAVEIAKSYQGAPEPEGWSTGKWMLVGGAAVTAAFISHCV